MAKYNGRTDASTLSGRLRDLGFAKYEEYLASDHWKNVRHRYKASGRPWVCRCGARPKALHHKTYVRLGAELLDDLEPVCDPCHRKLHGIGKSPRSKADGPGRKPKPQRRKKRPKRKPSKPRIPEAERRRLAVARMFEELKNQ